MATTRVAVAPMKAAQISKAGGDFEIVGARDSRAGRRARAHQGAGLRCLPQRCAHERRLVARHPVSARSRA